MINSAKEISPQIMLAGYLMGCLDIPANPAMITQIIKQYKPAQPAAEIPNDKAVVFILQLAFTVLPKIRQNTPAISKAVPKHISNI